MSAARQLWIPFRARGEKRGINPEERVSAWLRGCWKETQQNKDDEKKSYEWESGTALKWKAVSVFLTKARKNINSKDMSPWQQRKARAWNKSNQGLCVCMCEWDMSSTLLGNILTQWGNTQTAVLWKWVQLSGVNLLGGNQTFLEAIWTILHVSGALSSRFLWII